jgi:beta-fructofuranosidase
MAYTVNWDKPNVAVGLAVSDDLFRWEKQFGRPITCIDERFYERTGSGARPISHWRDPYLFEFDGHVYHYVCASVAFGPIDCRGTLGLARSTDMMQWEVLPPPSIGLIAQELECPQVLQIAGRYLLFFSAFPELFPSFRRENHTCELRHAVYCVQGASQFGPFFGSTLRAVLPADYPVQPYAGQIVQWKGKTWLLGTVWDDVQDYICDPIELFLGGDGVVSCLALERHTEPR